MDLNTCAAKVDARSERLVAAADYPSQRRERLQTSRSNSVVRRNGSNGFRRGPQLLSNQPDDLSDGSAHRRHVPALSADARSYLPGRANARHNTIS